MKNIATCIVLLFLAGAGLSFFKIQTNRHNNPLAEKQFKTGDLIFQTSTSHQSEAIQRATHSKYSHMGIIFEINSQYYVYEAIQNVTLTTLNDWIKRGKDSHFVVKRLKEHDLLLTTDALHKLVQARDKFRGKNYDIYFEWNDDTIYCSELVWKIYKRALNLEIGELQKLSDFDLTSNVVQKLMKQRFGSTIPYDEPVISPQAMFESSTLETIIEK